MIHEDGRLLEFERSEIGIHMGDTSGFALPLFRNLYKPDPISKLLNGQKRDEEILEIDMAIHWNNNKRIQISLNGKI